MKMRLVSLLSFASILGLTCGEHIPGAGGVIESRHGPLQNLVTYDEHSILIRGERLFLYSGEFHPFRLPVPGLWLDIFQKIKSLGFNGVSFYVDWALVEGQQGRVNLDGIWDLRPFFDAATEAGIYLIARPGPYINAETSAGGFPGWTLRIPCRLRSTCSEFEEATNTYVAAVGKLIADAQITNGGPVILVQPENEYSSYPNVSTTDFPSQMNKEYIEFVNQQLRDTGIVVPLINNDNLVLGSFAPGTGLGEVDIYGIDAYPVRYDCSQPTVWPTYRWPTNWQILHQQQSPSTPFMIPEFQGGTGTSWGNVGQDMCAALVGPEALRVFYKNNYSFGVKILNIYMTYGGTNWGNLGYMGGDTSYDYGASITEDRHVWREKFSEQKLQANFFRVSPAYLTATPGNATNGTFASTMDVSTTPLFGQNGTNFYVVRHADFTSTADTSYALTISTSLGNVTIPQLGGQLMLMGRDSKVMVTDYDVGGVNLIYSTADIFTWAKSMKGKIVLIMYGTIGELHEFALPTGSGRPTISPGSSAKIEHRGDSWVVQWTVTEEQQLVRLCKAHLEIRLLWRNDAFNYWTPELSAPEPIGNFSSPSKSFTMIKGGYLLRTATIHDTTLVLTGDFNSTTDLELVHEPTGMVESIVVNDKNLVPTRSDTGNLVVTVHYDPPSLVLPDFSQLEWKSIDSMPELAPEYDDSAWTNCNNTNTTNNQVDLVTPTSLYASDYGYHSGSLVYRGYFISNGNESNLFLNMSGGWSFAYSAFLNSTFIGAWIGSPNNKTYAQTLEIPTDLISGQPYVFTVLMDFMGLDEEAPGTDAIKFPSGILDYSLSGREAADVSWKITGNLGGEDYIDLVRGPRNEGGMFVERQGYHLPEPPSDDWSVSSPIDDGLDKPGVLLYTTTFDLHVPKGYDVPLSFVFANDTDSRHYRVQLFVNGYQYGKFIPYLGPEFAFPVPEGILNYDGPNYLALTLWALDTEGAQLGGLRLEPQMPVWSGMRRPELSPQPAWERRSTAY